MDTSFWDGKRAPGVPDTLDLGQFTSVAEVFDYSLRAHSSKTAFSSLGATITYAELEQASNHFMAWLQTHTNLKPGDRIAVQMPNTLQYPIAALGIFKAGLVLVNTNPLYTAREMIHQFNDSGATALLFMDTFGGLVEEVLPQTGIETVIVTSLGDMLPLTKRLLITAVTRYVKKVIPAFDASKMVKFRDALALGAKVQNLSPTPLSGADDVVALQYTGGTTGVAKGAELTNRNLVSNMMQIDAVSKQITSSGEALRGENEIVVAPLPLYHIYAFTVNLMYGMYGGALTLLIANPRDAGMFLRALKGKRFTSFTGLNTLFVSLMNHPEFKNLDFSGLKMTGSGGTALSPDTAKRWEAITSCRIGEGFGLTECSPVVCASPAGEHIQAGTVGLAAPGTALKVIDTEENELPIGERGELCVQGPQVMKGYWNRPEATAECFTKDGWFKTGDVAVIQEDGFVRIVDRVKDLVLVSGFNVYPNEIEDVVTSHPMVEFSAVVGIPDEKTGEAVKLYVVANDESLTKESLIAHCRENLTAYKVPRQIEFRKELPMSAVGKILRKELRAEALAETQKSA
jgi:long-chain acyl-CoA synthetase